MKLRTQLIVSMAVFGAMLLAIAASVLATNREVERLNGQAEVSARIERDASELSYLWNDYLLYRESQLRARWESKFAAFSSDVASLTRDTPERRALVDNITGTQRRLEAVFADVASKLEGASPSRDGALAQAFVEDSWSRMAVQNQAVFFDASRLSQLLRGQVDHAKQTNIVLIFALLVMFGAYFLTNYLLIYRRTLRSIGELHNGTKIIGSGDLDFAIAVKRDDEIGELSRAFNRMTASLKRVTASKVELEREIVERKRAEAERERLLAEMDATLSSVADGLIIYGPAGEVLRMNASAGEILGWSPEEKGKPLLEPLEAARIETPDGNLLPAEELPAARALRGDVVPGVVLLVRRHGESRLVTASAGPIRGPEGRLLGAVVNFADVTALHRLQERQKEFVSLVSHDLRNPLTSLMGTAQLLERGLGKEDLPQEVRFAESIVKSAMRMEAMIRDLADSAQLEAGSLGLRKEPTDLLHLIFDLIESVGRPEDSQRISVETAEAVPPVLVDVQRLERAITNVLTNALKYSPSDKAVEVHIGQRNDEAVIAVRDQGVGIPPEDLPHIFERNYRARTAGKKEGLGLGLYITRLIVELHGGRVSVESEVGQGSTFYLSLPLE